MSKPMLKLPRHSFLVQKHWRLCHLKFTFANGEFILDTEL